MGNVKSRSEIDNNYKWDIQLMYENNKKIDDEIKSVKELTKNLLKKKDHILDSSMNLLHSLEIHLEIEKKITNLNCFVNMKYHEDTSNDESLKKVLKIDKFISKISNKLAFFEIELLKCDNILLEKYMKENKNLEIYKFYFHELFLQKPYFLSLKEEELIAKLQELLTSGEDIYDKINNTDISFEPVDINNHKEELTNSNYSIYLKNNNQHIRKEAFKHLYKSYGNLQNTIATCLTKNINASSFLSQVRGYNSTCEMYLKHDNIPPLFYNSLITKVNENLDKVYKYMNLRKKVLNLDEMHMYDLYVPLVSETDKTYSFADAKKIVTDALGVMGYDYCNVLQKAFNDHWIDVYPNKYKRTGAYSWGSYDSKPYLLLNFEGKYDDVSTLAHELGHSIHSYYANENQPFLYSSYSIFVAEIASIVNELILNRYLYLKSNDKKEKLSLLNELLDHFRTTIIRQIMFAEFEKIIYEKEDNNEILTCESYNKIYYDLNKKYYGTNVFHDEEIMIEWTRIPHFYNGFYVYKYATGMMCALKIAYSILNGDENMKNNYLELLKCGGKNFPLELLKKCGIDLENDDTIDTSFKIFNDTIEEFKKLYYS